MSTHSDQTTHTYPHKHTHTHTVRHLLPCRSSTLPSARRHPQSARPPFSPSHPFSPSRPSFPLPSQAGSQPATKEEAEKSDSHTCKGTEVELMLAQWSHLSPPPPPPPHTHSRVSFGGKGVGRCRGGGITNIGMTMDKTEKSCRQPD